MTESVNTVIIGGGVLGCASAISTQKRLRKANGNNDDSVCLVEKTVISSGISARHSGIVRSANAVARAAKLAKSATDYWKNLVSMIKSDKDHIKISVVGKYVDLHDAYISVKEALIHAGIKYSRNIEIKWVDSENIEEDGPEKYLNDSAGVVVPGGFGYRGVEGMISAVEYCRINDVPYLGLCLGMQVMVIEAARSLLDKKSANSTEFVQDTPDPVIHIMEDQKNITDKGGTMRLGGYPCDLVNGTIASRAYGSSKNTIMERHRHRFEFNNLYREDLMSVGLKPSGISPDGTLVEIVEYSNNEFMLGTQFHPEFLSRPTEPHPIFSEFVSAIVNKSQKL